METTVNKWHDHNTITAMLECSQFMIDNPTYVCIHVCVYVYIYIYIYIYRALIKSTLFAVHVRLFGLIMCGLCALIMCGLFVLIMCGTFVCVCVYVCVCV